MTHDTPNANRGSLTSWGLTVMLDDNGCTDLDEDQTPAAWDNCRSDSNPGQQDYDGDGSGDVCDSDDDNDRVQDARDACPQGSMFGSDTDRDGCRDDEDLDDDGDGIADTTDACPRGAVGPGADHDGDGCQDTEDADDDNDGRTDTADACPLGLVGPGEDLDGDAAGTRRTPMMTATGSRISPMRALRSSPRERSIRGCPVSAGPTGGDTADRCGSPAARRRAAARLNRAPWGGVTGGGPTAGSASGPGPTGLALDPDGDGLEAPADPCPLLRGQRPHGCPVRPAA